MVPSLLPKCLQRTLSDSTSTLILNQSNRPYVRQLLALTSGLGAPTADASTARRSAVSSNLSSFLRLHLDRSLGGTALRFRNCNLAQFRRRIMEESAFHVLHSASERPPREREMRHQIGLSELQPLKSRIERRKLISCHAGLLP